jgi:hypothetical protein
MSEDGIEDAFDVSFLMILTLILPTRVIFYPVLSA